MPLARAFFAASSARSAAELLMAGVMPVMWNQPASSSARSQSMSPGLASAMALLSRS